MEEVEGALCLLEVLPLFLKTHEIWPRERLSPSEPTEANVKFRTILGTSQMYIMLPSHKSFRPSGRHCLSEPRSNPAKSWAVAHSPSDRPSGGYVIPRIDYPARPCPRIPIPHSRMCVRRRRGTDLAHPEQHKDHLAHTGSRQSRHQSKPRPVGVASARSDAAEGTTRRKRRLCLDTSGQHRGST